MTTDGPRPENRSQRDAASASPNFIIRSKLVSGPWRPVRCTKLACLLRRLGLKKLRDRKGNPVMMMGPRLRLDYVWEEANTHWRKIRRTLHPDVPGGDAIRFAVLSGIHTEIERRMRVKGILAALALMFLFTGCHVLNPDGEKHKVDIPESWRYQGEPDPCP